MDPEDQQLSDVDLGHGYSEEKKLAGGDIDGAKAVDLVNTVETNPNPAQNLRVCDFCGKTFTSGKALGGHRRSHFQVLKAERPIKKKAKNHAYNRHLSSKDKACGSANMNIITGHMSRDEKKHTCCLCGKDFPSMKSLFGHMRCHPGRAWKGILPPPNFSSPTAADALAPHSEEKSCSLSSTSSVLGEYGDVRGDGYMMMNPDAISLNIPAAIPVDLLKDMSAGMRWKATAKRGRKSIGAVAAAEVLVHLSRGKFLPSKINNQCTKNEAGKISEFSLTKKKRGVDDWLADPNKKPKVRKIKLICRSAGPVKLGDKAFDEVCKEGGNFFNSSQQNMGNAHDDDNDKQRPKETKNPEVEEGTKSKGIHLMKSSKHFDGISELSKKKMKKTNNNSSSKKKMDIMSNVNSCNPDSYNLGRCSKTLPTFQALRGHRSSQNKDINSIPLMDEERTPDASIVQKAQINEAKESESIEVFNTMIEEANNNSKNCNQTVTDHASLGEASQSCHNHGASGEATQPSVKMLDIDLNLPYVMEDEGHESSFLQA